MWIKHVFAPKDPPVFGKPDARRRSQLWGAGQQRASMKHVAEQQRREAPL